MTADNLRERDARTYSGAVTSDDLIKLIGALMDNETADAYVQGVLVASGQARADQRASKQQLARLSNAPAERWWQAHLAGAYGRHLTG